MSVTVFLPCRKGSERVPRKNIKPFAGYHHGLIEVKLLQLLSAKTIDAVVLSTNDEEILDYALSLQDDKLVTHQREDSLASSKTSTDQLVSHAADLITDGDILWTHVTSPFLTAEDYDAIISRYFQALEEGFDSLMTTSLIRGFLWNETGPVNYDPSKEKWPRTQTLTPLHEINSGAFVAPAAIYRELDDRIGQHPMLYPVDKMKGFDIDWNDDFIIAESIVRSGQVEL